MFGYLGDKSDAELLSHVAATDGNADVAGAAFASTMNLYDGDPQTRIQYLWKMGEPDSQVRELAIDAMRTMRSSDPAAFQYSNILALMNSPDNLPAVADQINSIASPASKSIAFEQAMQLGDWPGYRKNLALIVLRQNPSLRVQALEALQSQPFDNVKQNVQQYASDNNAAVRDAANRLLLMIDDQSVLTRAQADLNSGKSLDFKTINALGRLGRERGHFYFNQGCRSGRHGDWRSGVQ